MADNLTNTIDLILDAPGSDKRLKVGEVVESVSGRGFGTLLLLPALITFLPTGGIPGVPIVTSTLIVLIAIQLLVGRSAPWLPRKLRDVSFERDKFERLLRKSQPATRRVDKVIKPRYTFMTGDTGRRCVAILCLGLALSLIPLGPIPFAAAIPSGILVLLSLGLVARDGLLIMLGAGITGAAIVALSVG